jgi:glycopeptide antibiotics resistance protein
MGTVLNVLIFIPLGLYLGILQHKWSFVAKALTCTIISLAIETFQYILAIGAFDITDVITNLTGGFIGLIIYNILEKIMQHPTKAQRFINLFAAIGTIGMIILLFMLKMDMLPIRYQ